MGAGKRGCPGCHGHRRGQCSRWHCGVDECRAAPRDGCGLYAAELHHGGIAEALAEDADLGALLAGGGHQTGKRRRADVQAEEHASVHRAALLSHPVHNPVRVLDQRPIRVRGGKLLQNGKGAARCHLVEVLGATAKLSTTVGRAVEVAVGRLQQRRCRIGRVIRRLIKAMQNGNRA